MVQSGQVGSMAALMERLRHPQVNDGERRDGWRHACQLAARLHVDKRVVDGTVEDLGLTGCRVRLDLARIAAGTKVLVDLPGHGICREGVIAWERAREIGVHFSPRKAVPALPDDGPPHV